MATVGGIIYDEGQEAVVNSCAFEQLDYCKGGMEPYQIRVPNLTLKELRHIDSKIPLVENDKAELPIPPADIDRYLSLYRYFPLFAEAELTG